jgi:PilZ domain
VNGQPDRECQILDVSSHGAKIAVQVPSEVPTCFELAIFQNDEKRRVCKVAWRRGKMLGVKFVRE